MTAEGTKGGDVNRPGSRSEIQKLPTSRCGRCGLEAVNPIVVDGACTNLSACTRRVAHNEAARKARMGLT